MSVDKDYLRWLRRRLTRTEAEQSAAKSDANKIRQELRAAVKGEERHNYLQRIYKSHLEGKEKSK